MDGKPKIRDGNTAGKVGCHGREDIPSVECAADRPEPVHLIRQVDDLDLPTLRPSFIVDGGEKAVIRANKEVGPDPGCDGSALRTNPGVHYRQVDCLRWKEGISPPDGKSAFDNILRGDGMGQVNELGSGAYAQDNPLHRADETILKTEISCEGKYGHEQNLLTSISGILYTHFNRIRFYLERGLSLQTGCNGKSRNISASISEGKMG